MSSRAIGRLRWGLPLLNLLLLALLAGSALALRQEASYAVPSGFLSRLSLPFRDWKVTRTPVDAHELALLQPDDTAFRRYQGRDGQLIDLAIVAGSRKRAVHTPAYCMPGGGWELRAQQARPLRLPGCAGTATQAIMTNDKGQALLVTYFFTDGGYATNNLIRFQARQFVKRLRRQVPLGALVRVLTPVQQTPGAAEKLSEEFCQAVLPAALRSLRQAGGR